MNIMNIISKLPKDLQDMIGTYNVEHRVMMRAVCADLSLENCINCDKCIRRSEAGTTTGILEIYCAIRGCKCKKGKINSCSNNFTKTSYYCGDCSHNMRRVVEYPPIVCSYKLSGSGGRL